MQKSTENIDIPCPTKGLPFCTIEDYEKLQHHTVQSGRDFGKVEHPGTSDHQDAFKCRSFKTRSKRTTQHFQTR
jgi:hypothetical protein